MSIAKHAAVLLASLLPSIAIMTSPAAACSCPSLPVNLKTPDQIQAWKLEHAADVVRGRITDLQAGDATMRSGAQIVVAKIDVSSVLKGNLPLGEKTILTGFGSGDCGIADFLLLSIAWQRDLILEVANTPDFPGEFSANSCGYGRVSGLND
jgi:hypothetical protein